MAKGPRPRSTVLVPPLCLLTLVALEEVVADKLRREVAGPIAITAILVFLYAVGFVVTSDIVIPRLRRLIISMGRTSRRQAGWLGLWVFYAAAYLALFYVFFVIETRGGLALLPGAWR
jgi:hypothetical protein